MAQAKKLQDPANCGRKLQGTHRTAAPERANRARLMGKRRGVPTEAGSKRDPHVYVESRSAVQQGRSDAAAERFVHSPTTTNTVDKDLRFKT